MKKEDQLYVIDIGDVVERTVTTNSGRNYKHGMQFYVYQTTSHGITDGTGYRHFDGDLVIVKKAKGKKWVKYD